MIGDEEAAKSALIFGSTVLAVAVLVFTLGFLSGRQYERGYQQGLSEVKSQVYEDMPRRGMLMWDGDSKRLLQYDGYDGKEWVVISDIDPQPFYLEFRQKEEP